MFHLRKLPIAAEAEAAPARPRSQIPRFLINSNCGGSSCTALRRDWLREEPFCRALRGRLHKNEISTEPRVKQDISGSRGPWPGFSAAQPAASEMKLRALLPFSASFELVCGKMRHFQELELRQHQHGWVDGGGRRFGASTPW